MSRCGWIRCRSKPGPSRYRRFFWTLLEVGIGAAFVILFTKRFVATPIQQLIAGTKAVSAMELDRPIEITRRSQELDELVDSFNRMRERLEAGGRGTQ